MPNKHSNLSIILYGLRFSPLPYAEKLKRLRDIGYRSIQGSIMPDMAPAEHKQLIDGLGMEFCCLAGGFESVEKEPEKYIEYCRLFDCDEVMIGTMPTECRESRDGYMQAIERINAAGRALARDGVYLGYHNHAQEFRRFADGATGMDLLYDGFDPAAVHFMLDTHWVQAGGGDILAWIKRCEGRLNYLHVKDYRIAPANYGTGIGDTDKQFAQIGDGNLPWPEIVETALAAGVRAFIVEQDFTYGEDPFDCAATSYATLKACGLY
ncbi:MAG: sugar phosphate isomerase/epimerase [Oscillospiraceae bacterium]|nr:sugar phosphate isomerase/epimerase [Oscillospiraceae bacterium]